MSEGRVTSRPRQRSSLQLSPYTLDWLADHEPARKIVISVWEALEDRDRAGRNTTAWRKLLLDHQPTLFRGRCTGCRRRTGRHFPCVV